MMSSKLFKQVKDDLMRKDSTVQEMLDEMIAQGYPKESIRFAEYKMREEKDLEFTTALFTNLMMLRVAKTIFEMAEAGELDKDEKPSLI